MSRTSIGVAKGVVHICVRVSRALMGPSNGAAFHARFAHLCTLIVLRLQHAWLKHLLKPITLRLGDLAKRALRCCIKSGSVQGYESLLCGSRVL